MTDKRKAELFDDAMDWLFNSPYACYDTFQIVVDFTYIGMTRSEAKELLLKFKHDEKEIESALEENYYEED